VNIIYFFIHFVLHISKTLVGFFYFLQSIVCVLLALLQQSNGFQGFS
jgi:hypothetical protein